MRRDRYYTLMAALPALEPLTAEERPPCSRVHLEKLLRMLEPEDAEQLSTLEGIMFFDRLAFDRKPDRHDALCLHDARPHRRAGSV